MAPAGLTTLDATALAAKVHAGEATARHVVEAALQRIADADPAINAFRVVMSEEALTQADGVDALSDRERAALPLAGVPIAIKDDTDVVGHSTMWGSTLDRGKCSEDAEVVRRLRAAGATIIGKTNVPELTLWPWTASNGWGTTRNPWNLARTPGGSSGGSAAAVSAGMAAMALGSDGGGSVRYPAGLTGLVGLKPQRDRVPIGEEHGSAWHGLIVLGPLTRSVRDAALFMDIVATPMVTCTFRDAISKPNERLTIAVSKNAPPGSLVSLPSAGHKVVEDAAQALSDLGHEIVERHIEYGISSLWSSTVRLLKGVEADVASLPDPRQLEARTRAVARLGRALPARTLRNALANEGEIAASINGAFDGVDVVLTPLCASPAPLVDKCPTRGALRSLRAANTSAWLVPWNVTGQPALSLPTGVDSDGMPTAIQLVGQVGDEVTLLALAAQFEAAQPFPLCRFDR